MADDPATVSTYHAFAGNLLREHGLLLPVEPDTRLLSETELWQLAFRVVCEHPERLDTDKTPAAVTAMVLRLAGQLAEHLVDTAQLRDTHVELERLVHTLPAGPYQRDRGPSQWLLRLLATQTERTELVPLIDAVHQRMRAEKVMDFGMQMASAARLAENFPQVGEELRRRPALGLADATLGHEARRERLGQQHDAGPAAHRRADHRCQPREVRVAVAPHDVVLQRSDADGPAHVTNPFRRDTASSSTSACPAEPQPTKEAAAEPGLSGGLAGVRAEEGLVPRALEIGPDVAV